jgi:hypothetical protein
MSAPAHGADRDGSGDGELGERVAQLACQTTRLRLAPGVPLQVHEAVAALEDLDCRMAQDRAGLITGLRTLQPGFRP